MIETILQIVSVPGGDVYHGMKHEDPGFSGFGEIYYSTVHQGSIKAWKKHNKMTLNLMVPVGRVLFSFIDGRDNYEHSGGSRFTRILSTNPYTRLTVPPGIWFGFQGLDENNLIANVTDVPHDPDEVDRLDVCHFDFDWDIA